MPTKLNSLGTQNLKEFTPIGMACHSKSSSSLRILTVAIKPKVPRPAYYGMLPTPTFCSRNSHRELARTSPWTFASNCCNTIETFLIGFASVTKAREVAMVRITQRTHHGWLQCCASQRLENTHELTQSQIKYGWRFVHFMLSKHYNTIARCMAMQTSEINSKCAYTTHVTPT